MNPTTKDTMLGQLMREAVGEGALKKMARRRLDVATGNVQSYARVLNGTEQVTKLKEHLELAAALADLQAEKEKEKAEAAAKKKAEAEEREAKKAESIRKEAQAKELLLPGLTDDVDKGMDHVLSLKNDRLKQILKYFFDEKGLSSLRKKDLQELDDGVLCHLKQQP